MVHWTALFFRHGFWFGSGSPHNQSFVGNPFFDLNQKQEQVDTGPNAHTDQISSLISSCQIKKKKVEGECLFM